MGHSGRGQNIPRRRELTQEERHAPAMRLSVRLRWETKGPRQKELVRTRNMKEKSTVVFEPENITQLAEFIQANKGKYHEIWIVLTKKEYADPQPVSFVEALTEAKKHGLIDSRTKTLSDQKYMARFTKRRPKQRK